MKKILMVLIVMLFAVSTVFAADDLSTKLDKNKDGKVSKGSVNNLSHFF